MDRQPLTEYTCFHLLQPKYVAVYMRQTYEKGKCAYRNNTHAPAFQEY